MKSASSSPQKIAVCIVSICLFLCLGTGLLVDQLGIVHGFDTGIYLQLLSSISNHGDWKSSFVGQANFLGQHFQPLILFFTPFYWLWPTSAMLFVLSSVAALGGVGLLWRRRMDFAEGQPNPPNKILAVLIAASVLQPTIAFRMFHSFVPEVLAWPLLIYQALVLSDRRAISVRNFWAIIVVQLLSGLCKETIWLVNGWVALVLAFLQGGRRREFVALGLGNFVIFGFLFFQWMPAHSQLAYYGLKYYRPESGESLSGPLAFIAAWFQNVTTGRSVEAFFLGPVLLTLGLPFLSFSPVLAGAVPGLAMVLGASASAIHHPGNHYLILVMPFLIVAAMGNVGRMASVFKRSVFRYVGVLQVAILLGVVLFSGHAGISSKIALAVHNPRVWHLRRDAQIIAEIIKNTDGETQLLLTDGAFATLFHHFRNVKIHFGFYGNSTTLSAQDFAEAKNVVTAFDVRALSDCRSLSPSYDDTVSFNYEVYYQFCDWLRSNAMVVTAYPDSGLFHFHY